jgi:hypothetical protein
LHIMAGNPHQGGNMLAWMHRAPLAPNSLCPHPASDSGKQESRRGTHGSFDASGVDRCSGSDRRNENVGGRDHNHPGSRSHRR